MVNMRDVLEEVFTVAFKVRNLSTDKYHPAALSFTKWEDAADYALELRNIPGYRDVQVITSSVVEVEK